MKGFTFYRTYWDVAQELPKKDRGMFYEAVANYMFLDQDDEEMLSKRARIAFKCIKPNLKTSKSRSESGQLGEGKAKSKTKAKPKQTEAILISSSISSSSSRPKCPKCGKPASRNQQMGRWECHGCWEVIG